MRIFCKQRLQKILNVGVRGSSTPPKKRKFKYIQRNELEDCSYNELARKRNLHFSTKKGKIRIEHN